MENNFNHTTNNYSLDMQEVKNKYFIIYFFIDLSLVVLIFDLYNFKIEKAFVSDASKYFNMQRKEFDVKSNEFNEAALFNAKRIVGFMNKASYNRSIDETFDYYSENLQRFLEIRYPGIVLYKAILQLIKDINSKHNNNEPCVFFIEKSAFHYDNIIENFKKEMLKLNIDHYLVDIEGDGGDPIPHPFNNSGFKTYMEVVVTIFLDHVKGALYNKNLNIKDLDLGLILNLVLATSDNFNSLNY